MSGEAGPENDVFSFGVLMLEVLVLRELWENNMFAHSVSQAKPGNEKGKGKGGACSLTQAWW